MIHIKCKTRDDFQSINMWKSKKCVIGRVFPGPWTKEMSYAGLVFLRKVFGHHGMEGRVPQSVGGQGDIGGGSFEVHLEIWARGGKERQEGGGVGAGTQKSTASCHRDCVLPGTPL